MGPALALLAFFVLQACAGATGAFASEQAHPASGEPQPLAAGGAGRTVRVGLYENKPKVFTGEGGAASGIFPDILAEIARRERWQLVPVPCRWQECLEALRRGEIDLMPDVAVTPEREALFDFHEEEVVSSWSSVYAAPAARLASIADLDGRRVAALKGSVQQAAVSQLLRGFGYRAAIVEADSFEEAFRLAAGGGADAVVANHFFGDYFHRRYGLKKTSIVFNPAPLYFATRAGANGELLAALDAGLRALKADPGSAYYAALARWMEAPVRPVLAPRLVWAVGVVSGLLALSLLFIAVLRWQVRVKTRHLAQANEALRRSEEKFRDLFEKHAAVKLLVDPVDGAIVEANEAAARFYGWPRERLRRMRVQEINALPPEQVAAAMAKATAGQATEFEFRHRLADGSVRDVVVLSSRVDVEGRPLLHSIVHDVSERRRLEEQLRQAQKMEAVGRLAGGVAHDYNNMLGVILGRTEIALSRLAPGDPLRPHLQEVLNAAGRSADITRQLLAFSRKQALAPRVLDVNEAVEEMLKMLRWLIGENIELAWLPGPGVWPVRVDAAQFDQVLANLCVNARDAIADRGKITIETDNVTLDAAAGAEGPGARAGEFVRLSVGDTGGGMSPEVAAHAFEPFFTTKRPGEGTGLGLTTVADIVRQAGGFVAVETAPGAGTTFRVFLPRHFRAAEAPAPAGAAEPAPGRGEQVLLVEDDQPIRSLCREMLAGLGYRVLEAASPGEALRLAAEHAGRVDVLMTDVVMPEMNGRELADRVRAADPAVKVLYMSGYASGVAEREGAGGPGAHFVQKPFTRGELAARVREALG